MKRILKKNEFYAVIVIIFRLKLLTLRTENFNQQGQLGKFLIIKEYLRSSDLIDFLSNFVNSYISSL